MLSWEYPPLLVGGLGRHVEALARELVRTGHEVWVVTRGEKDEQVDELVDGVRVRRAALDPLAIDFTTESLLAWAQASEHALIRAALPLLRRVRPEVVHAHDWLVAQTAITVAAAARAPLVATIHATEAGRHQGWLPAPLNRAIHSVESWLANAADEVITCSATSREEAARLFDLDPRHCPRRPQRGRPVPLAGAGARRASPRVSVTRATDRCSCSPAGWCTRRGCRRCWRRWLDCGAGIPGCGSRSPAPVHTRTSCASRRGAGGWQARSTGSASSPRTQVVSLLAAADVAVVPSLYEPFGLVALEAVAAGTPVVVSDAGGLRRPAPRRRRGGGLPGRTTPTRSRRPSTASCTIPSGPGGPPDGAARVLRTSYTWQAVARATAQIYAQAVS